MNETRRAVRSMAWACAVGAACVASVAGTSDTAVAGGFGLRTGFSASPGQWVVGLHEQFAGDHATLALVPSAEAGFGDGAFSLTAQADLQYRFPHEVGPRPYLAVGGAAYYFNPNAGGSDTHAGLNLVGGVVLNPLDHPRVLVDGRIRLTDELPKARVVIGLEF